MSVDIVSLQRDQKAGLVKGVIPPNGEVALRREIDDLLQDEELANLYLLAMEAFQQASYAKTSPQNKNWFAYDPIGGIHGAPITPWDNAANLRDDQNGMYCVHGKPTFPTWHRVYLAQFEVRMQNLEGMPEDFPSSDSRVASPLSPRGRAGEGPQPGPEGATSPPEEI